jgi:predicted HicB family RNase H-like nuclease
MKKSECAIDKDGPAIEYFDGSKEWCLNGVIYYEQELYKKLYELGKISKEDYFLRVL